MKMISVFLVLAGMCGCSRKEDFSCTENLKTSISIGASMDAAEAAVKDCGLEYSLDRSGKALHAIKRGEKKGLTQESRVVVIRFDQSDRVSSIDIKPEFTGP
jgi:hypothetical protein